MDIALWVEVTLFVVLLRLSGFFSSADTSLFSPGRIQSYLNPVELRAITLLSVLRQDGADG